jgi:hypothetical protein
MAKQTNQSPNGTSFFGTTIKATPAQLKEAFPESWYGDNDGSDKTNYDFTLETESGKVFTIYDWKYYRPLHDNETVEWHIGGHDEMTTIEAAGEVAEIV